MTTVLLTGFEPFGGETRNPSWDAVAAVAAGAVPLPDGAVPLPDGVDVRAELLPCVYGAASRAMREAIATHSPDVVIGVGQAGGRFEVTPERIAVNLDDAPAPDNAGNSPVDQPVVPGAPLAYPSGLPVKAIVAALRTAGIPASVSYSAGTYVCNHVFYATMHCVATGHPGVRAGFVHVPYATEQVVDRRVPAPSLPMATITRAVAIAVTTTVSVDADLPVAAGAVS